jgi:hypothetical protein
MVLAGRCGVAEPSPPVGGSKTIVPAVHRTWGGHMLCLDAYAAARSAGPPLVSPMPAGQGRGVLHASGSSSAMMYAM